MEYFDTPALTGRLAPLVVPLLVGGCPAINLPRKLAPNQLPELPPAFRYSVSVSSSSFGEGAFTVNSSPRNFEGTFAPCFCYLIASPRPVRSFECRNWNAIGALVNELRAVENAEYGAKRDRLSVMIEMGRIGARQFPWQRGFVSLPALYRSAFIYGQDECADHLRDTLGLTVADMTLVWAARDDWSGCIVG